MGPRTAPIGPGTASVVMASWPTALRLLRGVSVQARRSPVLQVSGLGLAARLCRLGALVLSGRTGLLCRRRPSCGALRTVVTVAMEAISFSTSRLAFLPSCRVSIVRPRVPLGLVLNVVGLRPCLFR